MPNVVLNICGNVPGRFHLISSVLKNWCIGSLCKSDHCFSDCSIMFRILVKTVKSYINTLGKDSMALSVNDEEAAGFTSISSISITTQSWH